MFCNNLCSWFSKNIVFSLSAREIISPIKLSWQINFFYPLISLFFLSASIQCLFPIFSPDQEQAIQMEPLNAEVDKWEVAVNRVLLQDVIGRGAFGAVWRALLSSPNGQPGNRTVAAKCFTREPPSICFIDKYVDLRGGYKNVLFGEGGGGGRGSKIISRPTHNPLLFTQGYAREKQKKRRRGKEQRNKVDNQPVCS